MACVYCDSYKLEKKHECAGGNIAPISRKCSLETSPDAGLKKHWRPEVFFFFSSPFSANLRRPDWAQASPCAFSRWHYSSGLSCKCNNENVKVQKSFYFCPWKQNRGKNLNLFSMQSRKCFIISNINWMKLTFLTGLVKGSASDKKVWSDFCSEAAQKTTDCGEFYRKISNFFPQMHKISPRKQVCAKLRNQRQASPFLHLNLMTKWVKLLCCGRRCKQPDAVIVFMSV